MSAAQSAADRCVVSTVRSYVPCGAPGRPGPPPSPAAGRRGPARAGSARPDRRDADQQHRNGRNSARQSASRHGSLSTWSMITSLPAAAIPATTRWNPALVRRSVSVNDASSRARVCALPRIALRSSTASRNAGVGHRRHNSAAMLDLPGARGAVEQHDPARLDHGDSLPNRWQDQEARVRIIPVGRWWRRSSLPDRTRPRSDRGRSRAGRRRSRRPRRRRPLPG